MRGKGCIRAKRQKGRAFLAAAQRFCFFPLSTTICVLCSMDMSMLEGEPISTLVEPLPIPPYESDPALSEDENALTWVSILARHSSSKKGHMGTIFVRRPESGDPKDTTSTCLPPLNSRIVAYGNNTPVLYARNPKGVPEIHAEALAICQSAARGVSVSGCTVYVSFPPCNDCFKLLVAAGIKRCVYKKSILIGSGDAVLVAAQAHGIEMVGTLDQTTYLRQIGDEEAAKVAKALERKQDEERDLRVRAFWASQGEDAMKTRARVHRWWEEWMQRYRASEDIIKERWKLQSKGKKGEENGENDTEDVKAKEEDDLDCITNDIPSSIIPSKRAIEETLK